MELSDIITRVRYGLRETTASIWTDAEITAQVNLSQNRVAYLLNPDYLPQLIRSDSEVVVAAANFDLAADFLKMASDPSDGTKIYPITPIAMAQVIKNYDANHVDYEKEISWIQNNDLYLYPDPTADDTVQWYYVKYPDALSASDNESEIQDGVIDLVIDDAVSGCLVKTDVRKSDFLKSSVSKRIKELNER